MDNPLPAPGLEIPTSKKEETKKGTGSDKTQTKNNRVIGQSGPAYVLEVYKEEPTRMIHVDEVSKKIGIKKETVNRNCSRLKNEGKLRRIVKGFYQYDPLCEEGNLKDLARSGDWKIENASFVRLGLRSIIGQPEKTVPVDSNQIPKQDKIGQKQDNDKTEQDTSVPKPLPGYPRYLPTGQEIFRGTLTTNGPETILISAKGKPSISLDLALHLIDSFQLKDDEWQCTRIEVNKNSSLRRFEGSFTLTVLGALLIKAYQHYPGDAARLEIANRKTISMREVTDLFNYLDAGITTTALTRQVEAMKKEVISLKKDMRYAVNTIAKLQDRIPPTPGPMY